MATATVKIDDKALLKMIERTTGKSSVARVAKTLKAAAEELGDHARGDFPVSRWNDGRVKNKDHARDTITVVSRLTPTTIVYRVVSDSPYIYYIKSYQIEESLAEQEDRFTRRPGESDADYESRKTVGRKRSAWNTLVARPGKKMSKQIAEDLAEDLLKLSQGR
jgi:hypothetical protein